MENRRELTGPSDRCIVEVEELSDLLNEIRAANKTELENSAAALEEQRQILKELRKEIERKEEERKKERKALYKELKDLEKRLSNQNKNVNKGRIAKYTPEELIQLSQTKTNRKETESWLKKVEELGIKTKRKTKYSTATQITEIRRKDRNTIINIGQWNVRTLYQAGKLMEAVQEMEKYKISLLGISETRWNGVGEIRTTTDHTFLYSGKKNEDADHEYGVGIILRPEIRKQLLEWQPISERIITVRINFKNQKMTFVQCYAPTDVAADEDKEHFYSMLNRTLDQVDKHDVLILMGDFNAKVGVNNEGLNHIMGKQGMGTRSENGELLIELCGNHKIVIGGTLFAHKQYHKITWTSPTKKLKTK